MENGKLCPHLFSGIKKDTREVFLSRSDRKNRNDKKNRNDRTNKAILFFLYFLYFLFFLFFLFFLATLVCFLGRPAPASVRP